MPRSKLPSLNSIKDGSFEPNRKNAISLGDDSVLSADSKPIKIGDKSSILELSEDSLIIRGAIEFDTLLRGILNSPNERMAFTARTGEYRWYSTSNDEDYVRMYVLGGNCLLQAVDASGGTEADISLDAGNDIILDAETGVFKFEKAGALLDLCTLTVAADGATTIATTDSDGTAGHLGLDIDGDIVLDSASGNITAKDNGGNYTPSSDYHVATKKYVDDNAGGASALNDLSDVTYSSGDLTISSLDKIITSGGLELESGGVLTFNNTSTTRIKFENSGSQVAKFESASLFLKEDSAAQSDGAAFGQIWIKDDTPNCLSFTDDAGTDIIGIGKYHYETKFVGFYAGQTAQYIPMTGYIIEKTSTTHNNEFISFVAPYNCTIEKFIYRSEVAQDGTFSLRILESSDNTEVPSLVIYRKDTTIDIADDTFLDYDLTSPGTGSDYAPLTKGKIYAIYVATPTVGYDTNITVVFKWDITS
tara:strand:+ start:4122 stop:5549 length:1428 start_codon:yes stop_codon:yes gene_type:complete